MMIMKKWVQSATISQLKYTYTITWNKTHEISYTAFGFWSRMAEWEINNIGQKLLHEKFPAIEGLHDVDCSDPFT